jgi:hypothetical protein
MLLILYQTYIVVNIINYFDHLLVTIVEWSFKVYAFESLNINTVYVPQLITSMCHDICHQNVFLFSFLHTVRKLTFSFRFEICEI